MAILNLSSSFVYLLPPYSKLFRTWETVQFVAIIMNCTVSTFAAVFDSMILWMWIVAWVCDGINCFTIVLSFYVTFIDRRGIYVMSCDVISRTYVRSMFLFDVLSVIPTELVVLIPGIPIRYRTWRVMALFRANRLFGLRRVFRFIDTRQNELDSNASMWHWCKCLSLMVFVLHLPTCLWYWLACTGFHKDVSCSCGNFTWAQKTSYDFEFPKLRSLYSENVCHDNDVKLIAESYVISLYWTVTTALTIGFGDITASNFAEEIVCIFAMLVGMMTVDVFLLSEMSLLLTNKSSLQAASAYRIAIIKKCLKDRKVSIETSKEIIGLYKYLLLQKRYLTIDDLFDILPTVLYVEFQFAKHRLVFDKEIFQVVNHSLQRMLSLHLEERMYLPQQVVTVRGLFDHNMYYIIRGEVEVLSEKDDVTPVVEFQEGKLFGEICLLYSVPRRATVLSKTYCNMYVLDRKNIDQVMKYYPEEVKKMEYYMNEHMKLVESQTTETDFDPPDEVRGRQMAFWKAPKFWFFGRKTPTPDAGVSRTVSTVLRVSRKRTGRNRRRVAKWMQKTVIQPDSVFYRVWEICVVIVAIILALVCSFVACFYHNKRSLYSSEDYGPSLWKMLLILDIFLIVDIFISLRLDVTSHYGIKTDFRSILTHYVLSYKFVLDVLAFIPIERFSVYATHDVTNDEITFAFLKCNRLLKLYRVSVLFDRMEESLVFSNFMKQAIKLFIYTILLCHFAACWFYATACFMSQCSPESWLIRWTSSHSMDLTERSTYYEYVLSLYYGVVVMTSTGYGDITSSELFGFITAIVVEIIGVLAFTYAFALLSSTLANMDTRRFFGLQHIVHRRRFQERLFAKMIFMKSHNLKDDLRASVVKYFTVLWQQYRGIWVPGKPSMFSELPLNLQYKANVNDVLFHFSKLPLFHDLDEDFMNEMCLKVTRFVFSPGEIIVKSEDAAYEMYVINRGVCQRLSPDQKYVVNEMGPGHSFGTMPMLFRMPYMGTVCAKCYCEVFVLNEADINDLLAKYPKINSQFKQILLKKEKYEEVRNEFYVKIEKSIASNEFPEYEEEDIGDGGWVTTRWPWANLGIVRCISGDSKRFLRTAKMWQRVALYVSYILWRYTLKPTGWIARVSTFAVTAVGVFLMFLTPLHASFFHDSALAWTLAYVADSLVVAYMIFIALHMAYYNENNALVYHYAKTASHYFRTTFFTDLVCVFPFEMIVSSVLQGDVDHVQHATAFARYNRLIHFWRFVRAWDYLESFVYYNTGNLRLMRFGCNIMFVTVLVTCALFTTACPPLILMTDRTGLVEVASGHWCRSDSWIMSRSTTPAEVFNIEAASLFDTLTRSVYFASTTLVTLGYGDYSAQNFEEMVVLIIIILTGQIFYTYLMASITACIANEDKARVRFTDGLANVRRYMSLHELDSKLCQRVINHYEYVWVRTKGVEPKTMFNSLSPYLWESVSYSLYGETISKITLFQNAENVFIRALSRCIHPIFFLRDEFILRCNDTGTEMYFIYRGEVEVVSEYGDKVYDTLRVGDAFGELALLFGIVRTASVRAKVNSDLFTLTKADLDMLIARYPSIRPQIYRIANHRLGLVDARNRDDSDANEGFVTANSSFVVPPEASRASTNRNAQQSRQSPESIVLSARDVPSDELKSMALSSNNSSIADQPSIEDSPHIASAARISLVKIQSPSSSRKALQADVPSSTGKTEGTPGAVDIAGPSNVSAENHQLEGSSLSDVRPKVNLEPKKYYAIRPNNLVVRLFESLMCFLGVVSCCVIIFTAAFLYYDQVALITVYSIQAMFLLEMMVTMSTAYYDEYGNLVEDLSLVRRHYFNNPRYFVLDALSVIPFEIFALAAPHHSRMEWFLYIRCIHLLRIIHVKRFFNNRTQELNDKMFTVKLLKIAATVILTLHLFTCIWYRITCPNRKCQNSTVKNVYGLVASDTTYRPHSELVAAYFNAFYWTVATASTTGYGDILPMSQLEMWYAIFVMTFFKVQMGFILGDITSGFVSIDSQRIIFQEKLSAFQEQVQSQRVPDAMVHRMMKYFSYLWIRNKGVNYDSLFADLPLTIRSEVAMSLCRQMLLKIPYLIDVSDGFLRMASVCVRQDFFGPGEFVVHLHDLADEIFYILNGKAAKITDDPNTSRNLEPGMVFGEVGTLLQHKYGATVKTTTHVDLLSISWSDLTQVLKYYPEIRARAYKYAFDKYKIDNKDLRD